MAVVGGLAAAAASIYIIQNRRRKRKDDDDDETTKSNSPLPAGAEPDFYQRFGVAEENLPSHIRREISKERKRKAKVELISMKTPMYDNVYMLDQNRDPMCTISMKKARWYVKKGIAEWSSFKEGRDAAAAVRPDDDGEGATCIRLLFEHNGSKSDATEPSKETNESETLYLRSAKQNICVVCGDDGYHIRHYIVPYAYRTLLPERYRTHMSHDVVITCPDCHLLCERPKKERMRRMEDALRTRTGAPDVSPVIDDPVLHHVRSCAIALVKWRDRMPAEKVESHERTVREYLASVCDDEEEKGALLYGREGLTKAQLQRACGVKYRVKNPNYVEGAELVTRSLEDAKSTEEFIVGWREHFVATAGPRHMPTGWRVDNPVVCGSRKDGELDCGVKTW